MSSSVAARQKMVDGQIRTRDVTDMRILEAMLAVPRERFLPQASTARSPISTATSRLMVSPARSAATSYSRW